MSSGAAGFSFPSLTATTRIEACAALRSNLSRTTPARRPLTARGMLDASTSALERRTGLSVGLGKGGGDEVLELLPGAVQPVSHRPASITPRQASLHTAWPSEKSTPRDP